jgi:DNA polymerase III subunit epsilon
MTTLVIIDTETTGLNHDTAEIIEIATCRVGVEDLQSRLIKPSQGIPDNVQELTGITEEMVENQPTMVQSLEQVIEMLHVDENPIFIAHHAPYDMDVLRNNLVYAGIPDEYLGFLNKDRWICTNRLSRIAHGDKPRLKFTNLPAMQKFLELDVPEASAAHRAEADVWVALRLFEHLWVNSFSDLTPEQLVELCWQKIVYPRFPFGKHKGKLLKDIPTDYYIWMCENLDSMKEGNDRFDADLYHTVSVEIDRRISLLAS